jgi:hypothetical protein
VVSPPLAPLASLGGLPPESPSAASCPPSLPPLLALAALLAKQRAEEEMIIEDEWALLAKQWAPRARFAAACGPVADPESCMRLRSSRFPSALSPAASGSGSDFPSSAIGAVYIFDNFPC